MIARTVEALNADADLRAVLFDGATPLAVSSKRHAADVPVETRLAVWLRDRACRFPGSRQPGTSSHVHHLVHREHGGDRHPDNLALVGDGVHTGVLHRHGWQLSIGPTDGCVTARRRDRTLRSLPRWIGRAPTPARPGTGTRP